MTGTSHRSQRRVQEQQRSRRLPGVSAVPGDGHPKRRFPIDPAKLKHTLVHVLAPKTVALQRRPLFLARPLRLPTHKEIFYLKLVKEIEEERCLKPVQRLAGGAAAGRFNQKRDKKACIKIRSHGIFPASVPLLAPSNRVVPGSRGSQVASRTASPSQPSKRCCHSCQWYSGCAMGELT